ncbi:VOC family protein [Actinocorallia sp. A-T 12471]|uniref:VOC family protein n=1 Tax=Actinocorallia sp. A-T 12471 TaxID=3089813 RepID=UPI0029CC892B|nr:VOC family protein [Actinocorallia sp. A-T 12471]MDX6741189.1 VOC family protein [Actinocorallia sp. A-T 12471]
MTTAPRFAHVVFQTSQPEAMREWYSALLDAHVVYEGHGLTFLTFDDEHHRIALAHIPDLGPKPKDAALVNHVAYTFDSLDALLGRYEELKAKGIEPWKPVQHGVTTSLYYEDPDGNHVELQVDNFATADEATAYMEGPEYDADPIGVRYRPELMVAARRDGVPVAELQTRAWALRTSPELPHPMADD